jgi:hypothetical protein
MMDAVSQGAVDAGFPAAGFKIYREGGKWVGLVSNNCSHYPLDILVVNPKLATSSTILCFDAFSHKNYELMSVHVH